MTADLVERRKRRLLTLFLLAGGLMALAAVSLGIQMRAARPDTVSGPVVPGLEQTIATGQRIVITTSETSYRIERAQRGDQQAWVLRDRGDFPVLAGRLNQLTEGLQTLRYSRRMTADPSKHDRLGVGDPRQGGRGVLVQIEDGRGALLVNLILGVEPSGLYVRRPDVDQTWAAQGELPPLRDLAAWLDLRPLQVEPELLARVEIMPAQGQPYILVRDEAQQPWRIASPPLAPLSQSVVRAAAERLTQLTPTDVQPAPAIQGPASARLRAITFSGITIDAELIESDGRTWIKLVARPSGPEQEAAALEINNRAAPWAYALGRVETEAVAPPLVNLVPGASE